MAYSTMPILGVNITDATTTTPRVNAGLRVTLSDMGEAIYVKAGATITAGDVLLIESDGDAVLLTTALANADTTTAYKTIGVAHVDITSGSYGWACTRGVPTAGIKVLASCKRGSPLYTTTTDGALDDTDTSSHLVSGIQLTATATGAAVTAGYLSVNPVLVSGVVNNT